MNIDKREAREEQDYLIFQHIMRGVLGDKIWNIDKAFPTCSVDAYLTGVTTTQVTTYDFELKYNSGKHIHKEYKLPLTVKKYNNMKKAHHNEKLMLMYITPTHYYIFDTQKSIGSKTIDELDIRNWKIKKEEYGDSDEYEITPTFFLPISECVMVGTYNMEDVN